jgi:hypothetical protein
MHMSSEEYRRMALRGLGNVGGLEVLSADAEKEMYGV